jgi:hypothetical protein
VIWPSGAATTTPHAALDPRRKRPSDRPGRAETCEPGVSSEGPLIGTKPTWVAGYTLEHRRFGRTSPGLAPKILIPQPITINRFFRRRPAGWPDVPGRAGGPRISPLDFP